MSLDSMIERYSVDLCVLRFPDPLFVKGRFEMADPTEETIRGIVEPVTPETLDKLPELSRTDGAILVYTTQDLNLGRAPDQNPDQIKFEGATYEVQDEANWSHVPRLGLQGYRRYVLVKVDQ